MKKLNQIELQSVVAFIQKRGFSYVDVQTELLDHVACRVEEIMDENSDVSLQSALEKAHAEFGIFGFSTFEDSVISGLSKKYNRLFWRKFFSFFGLKYILLVLAGVYSMYKFQVLLDSKISMHLTSLVVFIAAIVCVIKINRPRFKHYLVYRLSTIYFIGIGSFFVMMNFVVNAVKPSLVYGVNLGLACYSALIICFILHLISALKTARSGIAASEQIMEKYKLNGA